MTATDKCNCRSLTAKCKGAVWDDNGGRRHRQTPAYRRQARKHRALMAATKQSQKRSLREANKFKDADRETTANCAANGRRYKGKYQAQMQRRRQECRRYKMEANSKATAAAPKGGRDESKAPSDARQLVVDAGLGVD